MASTTTTTARKARAARALAAGAMFLFASVPGVAMAGKPGGGGTTPSGSCAVAPSVVAPGEDYVVTGSGLGADRLVNVQIVDSHGTQSFSVRADATGVAQLSTRSYWAGTDTVRFLAAGTRKATLLATCTFTVS